MPFVNGRWVDYYPANPIQGGATVEQLQPAAKVGQVQSAARGGLIQGARAQRFATVKLAPPLKQPTVRLSDVGMGLMPQMAHNALSNLLPDVDVSMGPLLQPATEPVTPTAPVTSLFVETDPSSHLRYLRAGGYGFDEIVDAIVNRASQQKLGVERFSGEALSGADLNQSGTGIKIYANTPGGEAAKRADEEAARVAEEQAKKAAPLIEKEIQRQREGTRQRFYETIDRGGTEQDALNAAVNPLPQQIKQVFAGEYVRAQEAGLEKQRRYEEENPPLGKQILKTAGAFARGAAELPLNLLTGGAQTFGKLLGEELASRDAAKQAEKLVSEQKKLVEQHQEAVRAGDKQKARVLANQIRVLGAGIDSLSQSTKELEPSTGKLAAGAGLAIADVLIASAGVRMAAKAPGAVSGALQALKRAPAQAVKRGTAGVLKTGAATTPAVAGFGALQAYATGQDVAEGAKGGALAGMAIAPLGIVGARVRPRVGPKVGTPAKVSPAARVTVSGRLAPAVEVPKSRSSFRGELRADTGAIIRAATFRGRGKAARAISPDIAAERSLGRGAQEALRNVEAKAIRNQGLRAELEAKLPDSYVKSVFRATGLDTKHSRLLAEYGSARDPSVLQGLPAELRRQVVSADKQHRKFFDDLRDQVNLARVARGEGPVPKRRNYYASVDEAQGRLSRLMSDLTGRERGYVDSGQIPRGTKPFFGEQRKRDFKGTDALTGAQRYFDAFVREIYDADTAARYENLANRLIAHSKGKKMSNLIYSLQNRVVDLRGSGEVSVPIPGLKSPLMLPNRGALADVAELGSSRTSAAQLGYSPSATLVQSINAFISLGQRPARTAKAALQGAQRAVGKQVEDPSASSSFIRAKYAEPKRLDQRGWKGAWEGFRKTGYLPLRVLEEKSSRLGYNAYYDELISRGIPKNGALKMADIEAKRVGASRAPGDRPALFQARLIGPVTKFTYESANNVTYVRELARAGRYKDLLGAIAGIEIYNAMSQGLLGYSPVFPPATAAYQGAKKLSEGKPLEAAGGLAGSYLSQRPLGLLPASLVPEDAFSIGPVEIPGKRALFGSSQIGRFGTGPPVEALFSGFGTFKKDGKTVVDVKRGVTELAVKLGLPAGGQEAIRMVRGAEAIVGGEVKGRGGNVQFKITDQSPLNVARAIVLGPYGTREGRDWAKQQELFRAQGTFAPSNERIDAVNSLMDKYRSMVKSGKSAGPEMSLSDEEIKLAAKIGVFQPRGGGDWTLSDEDFINESIKKLPGGLKGEAEVVRDKLKFIKASVLKSVAMEAELASRERGGKVSGEADLFKERGEIAAQRVIEKLGISPDVGEFMFMNEYEKEGFLEYLKARGKGTLAEYYIRQSSGLRTQQNINQGIPVTPLDLQRFEDNLNDDITYLRHTPIERDLASASKEDLVRTAQRFPTVADSVAGAINLVEQRVKAQTISASSGKSTIKRLQKLGLGTLTLDGGGSGGGGGRRGGRGKRVSPRKISLKKVLASRSRKVSAYKPTKTTGVLEPLLAGAPAGGTAADFSAFLKKMRRR